MDDILLFKATETTPEISFNSVNGNFVIKGYSLPNNPFDFYKNVIIKVIEQVNENSIAQFTLKFKLKYFNTASTKSFHEVIKKLSEYSTEKQITFSVYWELENDEDDVKETVLIFKELFKNIPFTINEIN